MGDPNHPFWLVVSGEVPLPSGAQLLGWKFLEGKPGSGHVRIQCEASSAFLNPMGNVQGGFLAAMLDETLGPALATTLDANEFGPTIELKVNFLRPAKPGVFVGEGRVLHRGGSIAFLEATLTNADGELVATATATVRIIRLGDGGPRP